MPNKMKAAAAFVCGMLGILTAYIDAWFWFALAVGIVGIIFGVIVLKSDEPSFGKGMAVAGTVGCAFSVCVGIGSILGYIAAYYAVY